jgi:sec-independent protein translocase protein TatA
MFGELSVMKLLLVAVVILVLFGRGKVSDFMGEFGKGVKSFKAGMSDEANPQPPAAPPQIPPAAQNQGTLNGEQAVDPTSRPPQ